MHIYLNRIKHSATLNVLISVLHYMALINVNAV